MSELLHRSFTPDLEVRSGGDGRTIYGIAVPWEAPQRIDDKLTEQFARGAFNHQLRAANRVRVAREHVTLGGTLIGAMQTMRDDAAGLYVELRVSRTPVGDETLELVRDGALRDLSIGFRERQNRRLSGGILERVSADLFEVAVVMAGAYGELATAAGVRSADTGGCSCNAARRLDVAAQVLAGLPVLPPAA
ncbi:HK97 family phage prohead protease [Micromonospora sp. NPDC047738]|uniref:HK97 family phage prohead protease n=1 Tax=Micromonospora sp. NPDC047738 TaxID=3155741 RepID=UPI0033FB7C6E